MSNENTKKRFSTVKEISRKDIETRPDLFQGRQSEFSEESVKKIVREGFDKSQDPIVVWYDKFSKKYIVISGHSRFEASRRLFEAGDKDLRMMPVKEFYGTLEEAIEYALLESNRSGTAEGLLSDVKAYKLAAKKGCNKECMQGYFKTDSYINTLQRLSFLSEKGDFIQTLNKPNEAKGFPRLQQYAEWTGELRKFYPKISDSHENEIFRYLYLEGQLNKVSTKEEFTKLISKTISNVTFDPHKPLNLKNFIGKSIYQANLENEQAQLEKDIEEYKEEIAKRQRQIARVNNEAKKKELEGEISQINKNIIRKYERINLLKHSAKQAEKIDIDLFAVSSSSKPSGQSDYFKTAKPKTRKKLRKVVARGRKPKQPTNIQDDIVALQILLKYVSADERKQIQNDIKALQILQSRGLGGIYDDEISIYKDKTAELSFTIGDLTHEIRELKNILAFFEGKGKKRILEVIKSKNAVLEKCKFERQTFLLVIKALEAINQTQN
jgi:hypothetical protein